MSTQTSITLQELLNDIFNNPSDQLFYDSAKLVLEKPIDATNLSQSVTREQSRAIIETFSLYTAFNDLCYIMGKTEVSFPHSIRVMIGSRNQLCIVLIMDGRNIADGIPEFTFEHEMYKEAFEREVKFGMKYNLENAVGMDGSNYLVSLEFILKYNLIADAIAKSLQAEIK